ncbi:MAG: hypothetical protein MI919_03720 [Holophagales bacterium]|nr:hypothetical protein [Holophagales bacterium]
MAIAGLAICEQRYETAFLAVDRGARAGAGMPEIETLVLIMRGAALLELGRSNEDREALQKAADCFATAASMAEGGSVEQVSALVNLASTLEAYGSGAHLRRFKPVLEQVRALVRTSRAKGVKRAAAFADWIEGRLALRLGSTREGIRRLRKAGQAFARAGFYGDALQVAADVVERGAEHGAEDEAFDAGTAVAVLIPRDSRFRPALEIFDAFDVSSDPNEWAASVRIRIAAG